MIEPGELVMILDLHRQGLAVSAIARALGVDRKTVRRYIARGLGPPVYGPREPRKRRIDRFVPYLRDRVTAFPGLTGRRLWRELRERGYEGGYTAVTDVLREIRRAPLPVFGIRLEQVVLARRLTCREREVLAWVAHGKTAWEIGEILTIAKRTVDEHAQSAFRKLGAVNRTQAVAIALRDRLIEI